jgi:hypothetical protein
MGPRLARSRPSRSTFYYQRQAICVLNEPATWRPRSALSMTEHKGRYGYRRITAGVVQFNGGNVNHKRVQRLMQRWDCAR